MKRFDFDFVIGISTGIFSCMFLAILATDISYTESEGWSGHFRPSDIHFSIPLVLSLGTMAGYGIDLKYSDLLKK